ncbi:MAG: hypothetical protein JWP25_6365 [Bradyrhizobium sp.]|nr:hypothetical protein [Bradyrhizobium sp.]
MSRDDEDRFRPRPGRIRSDARGGAATKSFFTRVRKIARQHGAGPPGASSHRKSGGSGGRAREGRRATWARRCLRSRPHLASIGSARDAVGEATVGCRLGGRRLRR